MKYTTLRRCCAVAIIMALWLGISFAPPAGRAQSQKPSGDDARVDATPGLTIYALATEPGLGAQPQRLVSFEATSPNVLRTDVRIGGLQAGEILKGIDFRPATGELFGLGSTSRLYRINPNNGVATQVGSGQFTPNINPVSFFGFDFNPVPDRIRVVSAVDDQDLRLNPDTGTVVDADTAAAGTQADPNVAYASTDPNAGDNPNIVGVAYSNNFAGTSSTTNYAIDARAEGGFARLVTQGTAAGVTPAVSPNTGQLFTVGNLRTASGAALQTNNLVGFDITAGGTAYVSLTPINPFDAPSTLYTVDLTNTIATPVGVIGTSSNGTGLRVDSLTVFTGAPAGGAAGSPAFAFSQAAYTVAESAGRVTITVTRTGNTTGASTVRYTTVDGTASQRMDYTIMTGLLSFAANQTSLDIVVPIVDDAFAEGAETFTVRLSDAQSGTLPTGGGNIATVTITDNDAQTATTNPIDTRDFFVRQQYLDFLNREPDAAGFAFWTGEYDRRVNACNSITNTQNRINCVVSARASISAAFFISIEFQATGYLVYRTYDVAFARVGTPRPAAGQPVSQTAVRYDEFWFDTKNIARGVIVGQSGFEAVLEANTQAFFRDFVQRPAFTDTYPTTQSADQFVDALFTNANITPTATERQAAITAYGGGGIEGRARALRAVAENAQEYRREFNRAFVLLQYFGYLRRNPDDAPDNNLAGYNFWLANLDAASQPNEDVRDANVAFARIQRSRLIEAFIVTGEYRRRFGPE